MKSFRTMNDFKIEKKLTRRRLVAFDIRHRDKAQRQLFVLRFSDDHKILFTVVNL